MQEKEAEARVYDDFKLLPWLAAGSVLVLLITFYWGIMPLRFLVLGVALGVIVSVHWSLEWLSRAPWVRTGLFFFGIIFFSQMMNREENRSFGFILTVQTSMIAMLVAVALMRLFRSRLKLLAKLDSDATDSTKPAESHPTHG